MEVRRVDLTNWALRTSPKFTSRVKYPFNQGFWSDQRSGNPNHSFPPFKRYYTIMQKSLASLYMTGLNAQLGKSTLNKNGINGIWIFRIIFITFDLGIVQNSLCHLQNSLYNFQLYSLYYQRPIVYLLCWKNMYLHFEKSCFFSC